MHHSRPSGTEATASIAMHSSVEATAASIRMLAGTICTRTAGWMTPVKRVALITLRCCFAEATARSAGSCLDSFASAWGRAVDVLKGLCLLLLLLKADRAAVDVDVDFMRRKKHAEAPAATRLLPAAQPSCDSIPQQL